MDFGDAYESFYHLNNRFQQCFNHSSLPYKINLDSLCKTTFEKRCQYIITGNKHRILSLRLSSWIAIDYFDSSFIRLESLILNEIKSEKLIPLLMNLVSIPQLFSLSVTTIGIVKDPNTIHQLIFSLPVLKYCNTTFKWLNESLTLSNCIGEISPIEYFVSKSEYNLNNLNILLSYMPRLIRLSMNGYLPTLNSYLWNPITLNNLTYFHLIHSMDFDEFEMFMSNFFHQLQVLRISSNSNNDYLDSNRWEQLISIHLPCLHTFDIQYFGEIVDDNGYYMTSDNFKSLFWIQRKWCFAHKYYRYNNTYYIFFCSLSHPFKKINTVFIRHAVIENDKATIDSCSSQLTMVTTDDLTETKLVNELNDLIQFERLKKLNLTIKNFDMNHLIKILELSPNIEALILSTHSSLFVSTENEHIYNGGQIINRGQLTFKDIQNLINIVPNLKSLEMNIRENDLESIIQFLLKRNIYQNHQLYLIGLRDAHYAIINRLQKVIDRQQLATNYSIDFFLNPAYLCL